MEVSMDSRRGEFWRDHEVEDPLSVALLVRRARGDIQWQVTGSMGSGERFVHLLSWVINATGPNEINQGKSAEQSSGLQALMDQYWKKSTQETQKEWAEKTTRASLKPQEKRDERMVLPQSQVRLWLKSGRGAMAGRSFSGGAEGQEARDS